MSDALPASDPGARLPSPAAGATRDDCTLRPPLELDGGDEPDDVVARRARLRRNRRVLRPSTLRLNEPARRLAAFVGEVVLTRPPGAAYGADFLRWLERVLTAELRWAAERGPVRAERAKQRYLDACRSWRRPALNADEARLFERVFGVIVVEALTCTVSGPNCVTRESVSGFRRAPTANNIYPIWGLQRLLPKDTPIIARDELEGVVCWRCLEERARAPTGRDPARGTDATSSA